MRDHFRVYMACSSAPAVEVLLQDNHNYTFTVCWEQVMMASNRLQIYSADSATTSTSNRAAAAAAAAAAAVFVVVVVAAFVVVVVASSANEGADCGVSTKLYRLSAT